MGCRVYLLRPDFEFSQLDGARHAQELSTFSNSEMCLGECHCSGVRAVSLNVPVVGLIQREKRHSGSDPKVISLRLDGSAGDESPRFSLSRSHRSVLAVSRSKARPRRSDHRTMIPTSLDRWTLHTHTVPYPAPAQVYPQYPHRYPLHRPRHLLSPSVTEGT